MASTVQMMEFQKVKPKLSWCWRLRYPAEVIIRRYGQVRTRRRLVMKYELRRQEALPCIYYILTTTLTHSFLIIEQDYIITHSYTYRLQQLLPNTINMPTFHTLIFISTFLLLFPPIRPQLTVAIVGTNDIHGKAFPTLLTRQDTKQNYNYGGLVYMASLIDIIAKQNTGNTLFLDAGDQFQGGIESSKLISNGTIMSDFYNTLNVKASSLGNHQFDFGPEFLMPYLHSKNANNLAANLRSQNGEINFLPKQKSSSIFQMANGIKIGVIGLSTLQTLTTTSGFTDHKFPAYRFLQYAQIVQMQSRKLKQSGVHAVILVTHIGDDCPPDFAYQNRTKNTKQQACNNNDQISKLIDALPEGVIDGVVQGHRHRTAHHYYKDIPYIGTINGGYYFNVMYLTFSQDKQLIDTKIQGPIPVCQKVFQNTGRCNYLKTQELANAGPLINWKFHNIDVVAHPQLSALYTQKYVQKMKPYFVNLVNTQIYLSKIQIKQSQLSNLITNLMHVAVPEADFAIMNPGGFRSEWMPGMVQYQHYYNMFPFENRLKTFQISGRELKEMLKIVQNGDKGFYQCWNICMNVSYVNQKRGFVDARFCNGTQIEQTKNYTGATIDFILSGGDDFVNVINKTYVPRKVVDKGDFKDMLKQHLIDLGDIEEGSLIDAANPRLTVATS